MCSDLMFGARPQNDSLLKDGTVIELNWINIELNRSEEDSKAEDVKIDEFCNINTFMFLFITMKLLWINLCYTKCYRKKSDLIQSLFQSIQI